MNDARLTELTDMHERGTIKRGHIDEMLAELRRLHAENEALRADALRYRWLKANRVSDAEPDVMIPMYRVLHFSWYSPSFDQGVPQQPVSLDAAIAKATGETK